ncbi:helix-turn-helix domain-containing protein, partial [Streptomyces sp. NPDC058424]|uniref:helix-turn-helix domain-containing protein n=1 Tax=Streptomyces sp. NPDC058424 TaxID=3346491 RepID=UPI00364BDBA4
MAAGGQGENPALTISAPTTGITLLASGTKRPTTAPPGSSASTTRGPDVLRWSPHNAARRFLRPVLARKRRAARYLTQDDRIAIADGVQAGRSAAAIAAELGKHRSTVYRELRRGRKADGSYNPWWAHN